MLCKLGEWKCEPRSGNAITGHREGCWRAEPPACEQSRASNAAGAAAIQGQPQGEHEKCSSLTSFSLAVGRGERRWHSSGVKQCSRTPLKADYLHWSKWKAGEQWRVCPARGRKGKVTSDSSAIIIWGCCNSSPHFLCIWDSVNSGKELHIWQTSCQWHKADNVLPNPSEPVGQSCRSSSRTRDLILHSALHTEYIPVIPSSLLLWAEAWKNLCGDINWCF